MAKRRKIHCCACGEKVSARLTDGEEVYPHRTDLYTLPFWICDGCGNAVGCHHKSNEKTRPLGVIATQEIKVKRIQIHKALDPIWKTRQLDRKKVYKFISDRLGHRYHTGNIRSVDEASKILGYIDDLKATLEMEI